MAWQKRFALGDRQSGNIGIIIAVLVAAGSSAMYVSQNMAKTSMKSREMTSLKRVNEIQQGNASAISYLGSALERDAYGMPAIKVVNLQLQGSNTDRMTIANGKAYYRGLRLATMQSADIAQIMGGNLPALSNQNSLVTTLEILGESTDPTYYTYDVSATTEMPSSGLAGSTATRPVKTLGRIKVAIVPACYGFVMNKSCYYYGGAGASCAATCSARSAAFDQAGTNYAKSSDAICSQLLDQFGAPAGPILPLAQHLGPIDFGCKWYAGFMGTFLRGRWNVPLATAGAAFPGVNRVCACSSPPI